jgi:NitT/TauT family transport system substrate-binding protein
VDVAVTWEPELARYQNRDDAHILFTSAEFPDLIIDGVVFPPEVLTKRRNDVAAMIRGWNRALRFAGKNPDQAFADIARYEKSDVKLMNTVFKGIERGTPEVNRRVLGQSGSAGTGVEAARQVAEFLLKFGHIKKVPQLDELFDSSFLD